MLAGKEASMDGEALLGRSSEAGGCSGWDWRAVLQSGGQTVWGCH